MAQEKNTSPGSQNRGIEHVQSLYKERSTEGRFDKVSIPSKRGFKRKKIVERRQKVTESIGHIFNETYLQELGPNIQKKKNLSGKVLKDKPVQKLNGVGFWMVIMCAFIKDILDVLLNLTFFLALLTSVFTIMVGLIIFVYLRFEGVSFVTRYSAQKIAVLLVSFLIEMIPIVNFLPTTVCALLVMRMIENNEYTKALLEYQELTQNTYGTARKMLRA